MNSHPIRGVLIAACLLAAILPALAPAKGTEDNPTHVVIEPSGNDVDANVTNEVEVKNDSGSALAVSVGNEVATDPYDETVPLEDYGPFGSTYGDSAQCYEALETPPCQLVPYVKGSGPRYLTQLMLQVGEATVGGDSTCQFRMSLNDDDAGVHRDLASFINKAGSWETTVISFDPPIDVGETGVNDYTISMDRVSGSGYCRFNFQGYGFDTALD